MFSFKCWLFGHTETEKDKVGECVTEKCTRCRRVLSRDYSYKGRAEQFLHLTHRLDIYKPVESITDNDGRKLEPGDSIRYKEFDTTFPGLHLGKSGTVEFLFENKAGKHFVKIRGKRTLMRERRIMGIRRK
jgi:hypothetical protein